MEEVALHSWPEGRSPALSASESVALSASESVVASASESVVASMDQTALLVAENNEIREENKRIQTRFEELVHIFYIRETDSVFAACIDQARIQIADEICKIAKTIEGYLTLRKRLWNRFVLPNFHKDELVDIINITAERIFDFSKEEWCLLSDQFYRRKVYAVATPSKTALREYLNYLPRDYVAHRATFEKLIQGLNTSDE